MSLGISSIDVLRTAHSYGNKSPNRVVNEAGFAEKLNQAEKTAGTSVKQNTEMFLGDVVINYPPSLTSSPYTDSILAEKSKEEMTLDEYKQWVMGEISGYPVSGWVRSTFSSGTIVIKEEAFERMKNDPEYEKWVMNRVRSSCSVTGLPVGPNHVGYDVIGASPEECYGYAGPIGNRSSGNNSDDGKSWWEERHEKSEELLKEQEKRVQSNRVARWERIMQEWEQQALESRQRMTEYFNSRVMSINQIYGAEVSPQVVASAMTAYDKNIIDMSGSGVL